MLRRTARADPARLHRGALILVVGGLYLELVGLVGGALAGWSRATFGLAVGGLALIGAAALTGLWLVRVRALPTVALATVGIALIATMLFAGGRGRAGDALPGGGHGHGATGSSTVLDEVDAIARTAGTRAALDRLDELTPGGRATVRHGFAHELGRRSFSYAGQDVTVAFGACDQRFDGACYHGVLQAFVAAKPQRVDVELPMLCESSVLPAGAAPLLRYECSHGLGHGLAAARGIGPALEQCTRLQDLTRQENCYGGVFMERVQATEGETGYRCAELAAAYQSQCFLLEPAASLMRNGGDVDRTLAECDQVPAQHVSTCYFGVGRDVGSITAGNAERAHQLCASGGPAHRSWCTAGTVSLLVSGAGEISGALAFCAGAAPAGQPSCFGYVGEMLATLHPGADERAVGCAGAQPAGIAACRRGAGLAP